MGTCVDPNLSGMSLCLVTRSFNPEKHQCLLDLFAHQYVTTGDPTKVLQGFLSVYTTGLFSNEKGSFKAADFDDDRALTTNCKLMELIETFESDTVILWNAILLKKRVLVYGETVPKVLDIIRSFPCLAMHRKDWNIFRPIIRDEPEHLEDLQAAGVYIAGTLDSSLMLRTDFFDVIVSAPDRRITVAEGSADDMRMGAMHREVLNLMISSESNGMKQSALIEAIAEKTKVVLERLESIQQPSKADTEGAIMALSKNEATNRWLCKLAAAEGII